MGTLKIKLLTTWFHENPIPNPEFLTNQISLFFECFFLKNHNRENMWWTAYIISNAGAENVDEGALNGAKFAEA